MWHSSDLDYCNDDEDDFGTAGCLISVGGEHKNKNRRRCGRNYPFTQGIKVSGPHDDDDDDDVHKKNK